jgi:hypothetical protein
MELRRRHGVVVVLLSANKVASGYWSLNNMHNYAVVKNGVVENLIAWDGKTEFFVDGATLVVADSNAQIGGTHDGAFHYAEPPVPEPTAEEVARQAKLDSVKSKLEALGLTTEEVQEAFGL